MAKRLRSGFALPACGLAGLALFIVLGLGSAGAATLKSAPLQRVPAALIEPGPGPDRFMLVVEKASQRLLLYEFKKGKYYLQRSFPCTTGENNGDKIKEGDRRTPEGFYLFDDKFIESELAPIYGILAFVMDYPNFWDRRLGKEGDGIWIHGTNRRLVPRDSNGCVALKNIDILELEPYVRLYDTPVIIYDKLKFKSIPEINREAARLKAFLEKWRRAWESKDFQTYRSLYSQDFVSSDGKDYPAWLAHKSRLNRLYPRIRVETRELRLFRHQGLIVALFDQYYRGGSFVSDGVKRLFIREKAESYKIVGEEWHPFPPKPVPKVLPLEARRRVIAQARLAKAEGPPAPGAQAEAVRQTVEGWLAAWRGLDLPKYLSYYHPDFRFKGMDLEGFGAYKRRLAEKYGEIHIGVEKMKIKVQGSEALVTFVQDYRSAAYQDYGLKRLVLTRHENQWRIKEESWEEIKAGAKP